MFLRLYCINYLQVKCDKIPLNYKWLGKTARVQTTNEMDKPPCDKHEYADLVGLPNYNNLYPLSDRYFPHTLAYGIEYHPHKLLNMGTIPARTNGTPPPFVVHVLLLCIDTLYQGWELSLERRPLIDKQCYF